MGSAGEPGSFREDHLKHAFISCQVVMSLGVKPAAMSWSSR